MSGNTRPTSPLLPGRSPRLWPRAPAFKLSPGAETADKPATPASWACSRNRPDARMLTTKDEQAAFDMAKEIGGKVKKRQAFSLFRKLTLTEGGSDLTSVVTCVTANIMKRSAHIGEWGDGRKPR